MNLQELCLVLNNSTFGTSLRESTLMFPLLETLHLLTMALLVGTVAILDLRLLGVLFRKAPVSQIAGEILPMTWAGFAITSLTGLALFIAEAEKLYGNAAFRWKLIFLVLLGLNPLVFHFTIYRRAGEWDTDTVAPWQARTAGWISLVLWSGVIIAGRAIAYY